MTNKEPRSDTLIQSYVRDQYFVSTAKRGAFGGGPGAPFFETMVWAYDRTTGKRLDEPTMSIELDWGWPYRASETQAEALLTHAAVCAEVAVLCETCSLPELAKEGGA